MRARAMFGAGLGLWLLFVAPGSVPAVTQFITFHVTNNGDSGPGSLRQAIIDANLAAPDNNVQILFDNPVTINLTTSLPQLIYPDVEVAGNKSTINCAGIPSGNGVVLANGGTLVNLAVANCASGAGFLCGSGQCNLTGCSATGNGTAGVEVLPEAGVTVHDFLGSGNGKGIEINGGKFHSLSKLTLTNNVDNGIDLLGSIHSSFFGNDSNLFDEVLKFMTAGGMRRQLLKSDPAIFNRGTTSIGSTRRASALMGPPGTGTVTSIISGNGGYGINISNCVGVVVDSFYIGTDSSGNHAQPNAAGGIIITDSTGVRAMPPVAATAAAVASPAPSRSPVWPAAHRPQSPLSPLLAAR